MARLPTTQPGLTSLGAVGGARGTAAGALRILVEFITQYDPKAVKQLEADIAALGATEGAISKQVASARAQEARGEANRDKARREAQRIISAGSAKGAAAANRRELAEIRNIGVLTKLGQTRLTTLSNLITGGDKLLNTVTREARATSSMLAARTKLTRLASLEADSKKKSATAEAQLSRFQKIRGEFAPKLGGLALGAVGGIFGGALFGAGFAAAEAFIAAIGEQLLNLVDPGRKARVAISELGAEVRRLAVDAGSLEGGAKQLLLDMGIAADDATVSLLAQAAAIDAAAKAFETLNQIEEIGRHIDEERNRLIQARVEELLKVQGITRGSGGQFAGDLAHGLDVTRQVALATAQAEREFANATNASADAAQRAARASFATEQARRAQAAAAQLAAFAEENLANAIQKAAGVRIGQFDTQIDRLRNAGPSARTRALESQIEKLQNASGGGQDAGRRQELANIAEERALILLRMRLRLMGTNINLEKYSGKFLLEAINAKLKALQKEAAAQDRLNKLLDLQFRMSQRIRRNEGESITDFLERRAQENRDMLSEQRDLERELVEERLRELQEKTQDEVSLQELSERAKSAASKSGSDNRIRNLQKELEKSREADRKATEAKIAAVEKQKKAYEDSAKNAERWATIAANAQIREAIRAAKTVEALAGLSGQVAGLNAAKNFLLGLLASGALSPQEIKDIQAAIARINGSLSAFSAKRHNVITGHAVGTGPLEYAEGGIIRLTNASTPFGSNVQFGERGTEGLVLQNQFMDALKGNGKGIGEQNFYLQKGDDWLKDRYQMKRLVKEAVSEAMR